MAEKNYWYENKTQVRLLLIFVYPIGLFGYIKCPNKPKITMIIMSILIGFCILGGILSSNTTTNRSAVSDSNTISKIEPEPEPVETKDTTAEQKYILPDQEVFLNYVKEQFKQTVDSGNLVLDTILIDPVEIEIREYKLDSGGKPDIALTAYVKEMKVGQQGELVSHAILLITLDWIMKQGFEPKKQWIMPSCSVMRREQGDTGQAMARVFGRSLYDPNTDSIDWSPAK
jgi:hypothetical protein